MTGTQYAHNLCVSEAVCSEDELETLNNALENLCYNKEYFLSLLENDQIC